ncbi:hypothetical protein AB0478_02260 [Streptomyces sp. NPDC051917]|uniref:hypothetical protein n=1 Tax=Streptomyces sp. NPDC051917 TaxID=3154754 RepID=UPI00344D9576
MNNDRPRDSRGRSTVEVLDEKVAGTLTKSYQYSPWGERLSQVKHNSDGTTEDGYYGYNSHSEENREPRRCGHLLQGGQQALRVGGEERRCRKYR